MLETFYDNQVKFFEKINVSNPFQEVATIPIAGKSAKKVECLTCYDEFPLSVSWTIFINVLNTIEYDVELRHTLCTCYSENIDYDMLWNILPGDC